jgi:hypothetical protein
VGKTYLNRKGGNDTIIRRIDDVYGGRSGFTYTKYGNCIGGGEDPLFDLVSETDPQKTETSDRASIELPESLLSKVTALAESEGVTHAEILRRALSAEQFLRSNVDAGNTLLVLEKGQTNPSRVVVFR